MKKNVSLNRFIAACAGVICVISVAILLIFDVFLINNYQQMRWASQADRLSNYAQKCREDLQEIAWYMDDIYVNNNDFIDLSVLQYDKADKNNEDDKADNKDSKDRMI